MGRPNKFNLNYFPLDVDFFDDHKLLMIEEECGIQGGYMAIRLMSMVYRDKGYYMEWPDKFEFTVAKRVGNGFTAATVNEIFQSCMNHGLFNKDIFERFRVVTSFGIQKRWLRIQGDLRRKVEINESFWILPSEVIPVSSEETTEKNEESTQNNIKLNEIKVNETLMGANAPAQDVLSSDQLPEEETESRKPGRKKFVAPTFEQVKAYMMQTVGNPANGNGYWPEDLVHNEANKLMDHYIANGWKQAKGKAIVDWQATCRTWIRNHKEGTFSNSSKNVPHGTLPAYQAPAAAPLRPALTKNQGELNYFFDRFREDPNAVTIISIDPEHYNTLKNSNLITFSDSEVEEIKDEATVHLKSLAIENSDQNLLKFMKKVGVLYFFKQFNRNGRQTIFNL